MAKFATLQHATYTEAEWTAWDGVLLKGQMAFSSDALYSGTDQMKYKVGNGTDTWTALDYVPEPSVFTGGSLTSAINEAKGSDIASAATTDIGAATGNFVHVTGTTTITALGTAQAGTRRTVRFAGALTLTHNATSLILPTGANITTAANDVAAFVSEGSGNWRCVNYMRSDGRPLVEALLFSGSFAGTNLADSVTYHWSNMNGLGATATQSFSKFGFDQNRKITKIVLCCSQNVNYSNESVSLYLRKNATTDYTITTSLDLSTVGLNSSKMFYYTVDIDVTSPDDYELKIVTPAFGTNGTNSRWHIALFGY